MSEDYQQDVNNWDTHLSSVIDEKIRQFSCFQGFLCGVNERIA